MGGLVIGELRHVYVVNLPTRGTILQGLCVFTKVSGVVIAGTVQIHRVQIGYERLNRSLVHARSPCDDVEVIKVFQ